MPGIDWVIDRETLLPLRHELWSASFLCARRSRWIRPVPLPKPFSRDNLFSLLALPSLCFPTYRISRGGSQSIIESYNQYRGPSLIIRVFFRNQPLWLNIGGFSI